MISAATSFGRPGIRVRLSSISSGAENCKEDEDEDGGSVIGLLYFSALIFHFDSFWDLKRAFFYLKLFPCTVALSLSLTFLSLSQCTVW